MIQTPPQELYKTSRSVHQITRARDCYLVNPRGLTDLGLSELMHVSRMTAYRLRCELNVVETDVRGVYRYVPSESEVRTARHIIYLNSLSDCPIP